MNEKLIVTGRVLPISEATKRRNPQIYSNSQPVAERVRAKKPEPDQRGESQDRGVETGRDSVRFRVTFTVHRRRLLDSGDNDRSACKRLRDLVTALLGFTSDETPCLCWHYQQVKSTGAVGTHILIEQLE